MKQAQGSKIITFGESMALFMPQEQHTAIERATLLQQRFGGAESNVAIGLARLGVSVGWFGALGNDPFGKLIFKTLRGEGVDVSRVKFDESASTGLMLREHVAGRMAVHYLRKHSAASQMQPADLDEDYIRSADLLHVTGITCALSPNCLETVQHAVKVAKAAGVKVSFDPNLRLKLWSIEEARAALLPLAEQADYFLPGWDELKLLYDTDDYAVIKQKLEALSATTIMKGKDDATVVLENGQETVIPFYPAEQVVDTVGAGDGFGAGFLAGISKGMDAVAAVRLGSIIGSLVVQMTGDWEALPEWTIAEQRLSDKQWIER